jgi:predicted RNase H-like HicB family nuclease
VASQGETREEALNNIKEAIEGYLEVKAELLSRKIKGESVEVVVEATYTPMTKRRNKPRLLRRGKVK